MSEGLEWAQICPSRTTKAARLRVCSWGGIHFAFTYHNCEALWALASALRQLLPWWDRRQPRLTRPVAPRTEARVWRSAPTEAPAGFRPRRLATAARSPRLLQGRLARRLARWTNGCSSTGPLLSGVSASKVMSRNTDARKTARLADGTTAKKNFNILYEIDGDEVGSVLRADEYGGDEEFSWVMLEPAGR